MNTTRADLLTLLEAMPTALDIIDQHRRRTGGEGDQVAHIIRYTLPRLKPLVSEATHAASLAGALDGLLSTLDDLELDDIGAAAEAREALDAYHAERPTPCAQCGAPAEDSQGEPFCRGCGRPLQQEAGQ